MFPQSHSPSVAAFVLLLWDHILTFEQEVKYIWPSRATVIKWLFLVNRYLVCIILSVNLHSEFQVITKECSINCGVILQLRAA